MFGIHQNLHCPQFNVKKFCKVSNVSARSNIGLGLTFTQSLGLVSPVSRLVAETPALLDTHGK